MVRQKAYAFLFPKIGGVLDSAMINRASRAITKIKRLLLNEQGLLTYMAETKPQPSVPNITQTADLPVANMALQRSTFNLTQQVVRMSRERVARHDIRVAGLRLSVLGEKVRRVRSIEGLGLFFERRDLLSDTAPRVIGTFHQTDRHLWNLAPEALADGARVPGHRIAVYPVQL